MKGVKGTPRGLFDYLHSQFEQAYRYIRGLKFSEEPEYDYIYQHFHNALTKAEAENSDVHAVAEIPLDGFVTRSIFASEKFSQAESNIIIYN